jgi:cytochrome c oxidase assembly factor CtaG
MFHSAIPGVFAAITATVSWSFVLIVFGVILVVLLYGIGAAGTLRYDYDRRLRWWNYVSFAAGLVGLLIVLSPTLNDLGHQWFWARMIQNESLAVVIAPLLLIGMPLWAVWHVAPQATRGAILRWGLRQAWPRRLWQHIGRWVLGPWVIWALFVASFSLWHITALYTAALQHASLNALELAMFLGTALLLWAQVIPLRPGAPARVTSYQRIIYLCAIGMHSNLLGSLLVFSTGPFYTYYVAQRHGDIAGALVDQHLAGTAMDVPGTILFFFALSVFLWFWLSEDEKVEQPAASAAGQTGKP